MSITLRSEAALITAIPFQLGFHPHESLVLVAMAGREVLVVARVDLAEIRADVEGLGDLVGHLVREGTDAIVPVFYGGRHGETTAWSRALAAALQYAPVDLWAPLVVSGSRWRHVRCGARCCGRVGRPIASRDSQGTELLFIANGATALADRGELARLVAPDDAFLTGLPPLLPRQCRVPVRADADWRRLSRLTGTAWTPGGSEIVRLARSLLDRNWRDAVIAQLAPGTLPVSALPFELTRRARSAIDARPWTADPGDNLPDELTQAARSVLLDRLVLLARRSPIEISPAPYTVTALVAFWSGSGALANVLIDRALLVDPDYYLAALVELMLRGGVRPGANGRLPRGPQIRASWSLGAG